MSEPSVMPELKQALGAMIFASARSLTVKEMRRCLAEVAETVGGVTSAFAKVREDDIRQALDELGRQIEAAKLGFVLREVAGGFRLQSDATCGPWLRHLLNMGRPMRLSQPALETLAVIAYRQPVTRADMEAVRGVTVDHVIRTLMEMQLVRIVGRSDLPGHPLLYATTSTFLEHFGLKDMGDLKRIEPSLLIARGRAKVEEAAPSSAPPAAAPETAAVPPVVPLASARIAPTPSEAPPATEARPEVEGKPALPGGTEDAEETARPAPGN